MSRLDESNDIISLISSLEKQSNEIKTRQIVGSDAVRTNKLSSSDEWDRDVTAPAVYEEITETFTIRFTAEKVIDNKPPAAFQVAVKQLVEGNYQYIESLKAQMTISRKKVVNPEIQEWKVSIRYPSGFGTPIRYRLKFYVMATGTGVITLL